MCSVMEHPPFPTPSHFVGATNLNEGKYRYIDDIKIRIRILYIIKTGSSNILF